MNSIKVKNNKVKLLENLKKEICILKQRLFELEINSITCLNTTQRVQFIRMTNKLENSLNSKLYNEEISSKYLLNLRIYVLGCEKIYHNIKKVV